MSQLLWILFTTRFPQSTSFSAHIPISCDSILLFRHTTEKQLGVTNLMDAHRIFRIVYVPVRATVSASHSDNCSSFAKLNFERKSYLLRCSMCLLGYLPVEEALTILSLLITFISTYTSCIWYIAIGTCRHTHPAHNTIHLHMIFEQCR